jgi:hypothetical protein
MILLPPHTHERAWLRSFWASVCLFGTAFVGILGWLYGIEFLWLAVAVGVLFAAGMIVPHLLVWPYRAWNKLARLYAGYAEGLVLRISYFTVCVPAGWAASQIRVKQPPLEGTLWLPRESQKPVDQPFSAQGNGMRDKSWIARYTVWAWQSGEIWRLAFLPMLLLLSALHSKEEESTVPENIYTLF